MQPTAVPTVSIYAGDYTVFPLYTISDENEDPMDLSGYTNWKASWRVKTTDTNVIALEVDTSNIAVGEIKIIADEEVTRAMTGNGVWDVEATNSDGVQTFLYGKTSYRADVTRD